MIKKILLLLVCLVSVGIVWIPPEFFCHDVASAKKFNRWFRQRYNPNIELSITPENGGSFFNRITDPLQREAAKKVIAALATRHAQKKPQGRITCAVVGNSGNLRRSNYGELIDSHTYVFRMNNAPIEDYEKDVGTRTTHHVAHSNTMSFRDYGAMTQHYMVMADLGWQYATDEGRADYADSVALKIKLLVEQSYPDTFPKTILPKEPLFIEGTHFPDNAASLSGNLFIVNPDFLFYIYEKWFDPDINSIETAPFVGVFPSIGFKTLILAFHLCDEVDTFGFGANYRTERWDHYYDKGYALTGPPAAHKWDYQEIFLKKLSEQRIIKMPPE